MPRRACKRCVTPLPGVTTCCRRRFRCSTDTWPCSMAVGRLMERQRLPDLGKSDLLDGVSGLVDASLIQRRTQMDGEPFTETLQFSMLETIREFGWERVIASGEEGVVREAHAAYVCDVCERFGSSSDARLGETTVDFADIRAALRYLRECGDVERVLALAGALGTVWQFGGMCVRDGPGSSGICPRTEDQSTPVRGRALWSLGLLVWSQGAYDDAAALARESLTIAQNVATRSPKRKCSIFLD